MLSKFSVKKPYTVLVGVVVILILGFVSVTEMTTDLLPNINLPYAVVMTTYAGASPEEVEETVTRPIESSMATISNIEEIDSVSSENYSLVIMSFSQETDMDSVSLEMRESLDQMESMWDNDSIGSPIIMKLNPNMMPIMVAAVSSDDMDSLELTDFIEQHVLSELESISGVASVTPVGEVQESIQVILRQDKINEMNEKIYEALDGKFDEARDQIADAKQELLDGQKELNEGWQKIRDGQKELEENEQKLADGKAEIADGRDTLNSKKTETADQLAQAQVQLLNVREKLVAKQEELAITEAAWKALKPVMDNILQKLKEIEAAVGESGGMDAVRAALEEYLEGYPDVKEKAEEILDQVSWSSEGLEQYIAQMESTISSGKAQLEAGLAEVDANLQRVISGNTTASIEMGSASAILEIMDTQLESAQAQIDSAKEQLDASIDTLKSSQEQLDEGRKQLADSEEELQDAIDDARDNASAENVLTADTVKALLAAQNFSMPAGYVTEDGIDYLVRVGNKVEDAGELNEVTLLDLGLDGLDPIVLSDVADVIVTDNREDSYAKINGNDGIMLSMQKQTGYSTGEVSDKINDRFTELEEEYESLHFTQLMDQGIYIDMIVDSVFNNMMSGAVLAILILYLFLKDIRPTFIIACSIPLSVLAAVVLMYFSGITLNVISLSGLALGIGMLVDNSIVVIENIYRMRSEGRSAKEAAIEGAREVSGAIVASTLTTVCVFLPIVFTKGITRQLFVDMGLTIGYSLLASLVVALTLVPAMGAGLLKNAHEKKHPFLDKVHAVYGRSIRIVLKHRALVLLAAVALLIVSTLAAVSNGTAFMPEMESTQMSASITLEEGSSLEDTGAVTDEVMARIMKIEGVTDVGAMVEGEGAMSMLSGGGNENEASVYILLDEKKDKTGEEIKREILEQTADLDCEIQVQTQNMDMSALGGSGISVRVSGKELDVLYDLANQVAAVVEAADGTENVSDGMEDTTQELRIVVDKAKAGAHNLTVAQVLQKVAAQIAEASSATTVSTDEKDYEVYVKSELTADYTREDVKNMVLRVTDSEGKTEKIPLADIADFEDGEGLQSIMRKDQTRYITVTADISDGYNIGLVGNAIEKKLNAMDIPKGYRVTLEGENEMINEAMVEVLKMLALAIAFIYLIMVAQFQSLKSPFIVMFTIPLAFTGGFLALAVSGMEVSVIAMIGFVMLSGIIVNNGIVLVDYVNQLRAGGMEKREALALAGETRLRPIVMTALTTILGLSTMAAGMGMGSDMAQPMAVVTIGGLIYGTILTLWIVPCVYDLLNSDKKGRKQRKGREHLEDGIR